MERGRFNYWQVCILFFNKINIDFNLISIIHGITSIFSDKFSFSSKKCFLKFFFTN